MDGEDMTEEKRKFRVWLEPLPATSREGDFSLKGGWYGRLPDQIMGINRAIYWRVEDGEYATEMNRDDAVGVIRGFKESGYPCRAEPPITLVETF